MHHHKTYEDPGENASSIVEGRARVHDGRLCKREQDGATHVYEGHGAAQTGEWVGRRRNDELLAFDELHHVGLDEEEPRDPADEGRAHPRS